ncbi:hypothetical protein LJB89_02845, partial [Tyzzerella sp. OttesenSCG-928-J15]|nr:hypothetical protein [Tyzzerella sp. OttesenSCG-928-J15]
NEEESREHLTLYDGALISAFSGEGESLLMFDEFVAELRERPERCMLAHIIHDGEIMSITETPYFQNEEEEYLSGTGTAVSNNGGRYVKYGGKIYYRLYERNYYEPEEINICIMELSDDGSREFLFPDDGFGNIYIYRKQEQACFILNRICGESYGVEYDFEQEIYGVSLDGEYLYHFGRGAIFAVDNERGLIIAQRTNDGICTIDIDSGHVNYLAQEGHTPLYYNPESGILYCADAVNNGWANPALCTINIHSGEENVLLDLEKETLNLLCGKPADWYRYRNITVEGDFLQLYLAGYSEATQKLTGSALLKIGADGFWAEIMAAPVDWFGKNKPFTISEENPFFDENTYGAYLSEGATIYMFGSNGEEKMLLDRADMFSIGLTCIDYRNGADYLFVGNREYVDGEFFFTVVEGISNYGENGYDIERCSVFRKNLETGEIVLLNKY